MYNKENVDAEDILSISPPRRGDRVAAKPVLSSSVSNNVGPATTGPQLSLKDHIQRQRASLLGGEVPAVSIPAALMNHAPLSKDKDKAKPLALSSKKGVVNNNSTSSRRSSISNSEKPLEKKKENKNERETVGGLSLHSDSSSLTQLPPPPPSTSAAGTIQPPHPPNNKKNKKNRQSIASTSSTTSMITKITYDDKWADKQEKGFTDWINFTFSQAHAAFAGPSKDTLGGDNAVTADDEESTSGLRGLSQKRQEARVRQEMMQLYRGESITKVMASLDVEINEGRLAMRDERDIFADLGLQETLLSFLFSYELPWLRLGLETVFGEIISLPSKLSHHVCCSEDPKWKSALKTFIFEHLLANEDISSKFSKQTLMCVRHEKTMKEMLRKHLLTKLLGLVLILDASRTAGIFSMPTLFVRTAVIKSSKELLTETCKYFLRGEGDVLRHLSLFGYSVSFEQSYIDEFDYTMRNIATDLRDGVRLARLVEILSSTKDLSTSLRVPAVSRLQKLHNVGLVLKRFNDLISVDAMQAVNIDPKCIVDGNRDKTLLLLWRMLYGFELRMLIDSDRVTKEVHEIYKNKAWRRSVYGADEVKNFAVSVPTYDANGGISMPADITANHHDDNDNNTGATDNNLTHNLILWCEAVAGQYGVPVYDLTSCLADGRALCLLIHYYHPSILPTKLIRKTSHNLMFSGKDATNTSLDAFTESNANVGKAELQKALDGERKNFALLKKACRDIGGIPLLLPAFDSKSLPEEKTMVVFLGYLFSRLVESSGQVRAAIRIQRCFRRNRHAIKARFIAATVASVGSRKRSMSISHDKSGSNRRLSTSSSISSHSSGSASSSFGQRLKDMGVIREGIVDVPVSIAISNHKAASMIQSRARAFILRRRFLLQQRLVAQERVRLQEEAERREREAQEEAERLEREAQEEAERLEREAQEEAERLEREAQEEEERVRLFLEMQARMEEEKERERELENIRKLEEETRMKEMQERLRQEEEEVRLAQALQRAMEERMAEEEKFRRETQMQLQLLEARSKEELELQAAAIAAERARREEDALARAELEKRLAMEESARKRAEEEMRETLAQHKAKEDQLLTELSGRTDAETLARLAAEEARKESELRLSNEMEKIRLQQEEALAQLRYEAEQRAMQAALNERLIAEAAVKAERDARAQAEAENQLLQARLREIEEAKMAELRAIEEAKRLALEEAERLAEEERKRVASSVMISDWIFAKMKAYAIKMQRKAAEEQRQIIAASLLQAMWRRRIAKRELLRLQANAATLIASVWRMYQARGIARERRDYLAQCKKMAEEEEIKARYLEAGRQKMTLHARGVIITFMRKAVKYSHQVHAVNKIKMWYMKKLPLIRVRKLCKGFLRLQAFFRSMKVRRKRSAAVKAVHKRILAAEASAKADPSLKLGKKTQAALHTLQTGKVISQLLKACETLDMSTQLSFRCCQAFVATDSSPVLFGLIRSCNRSTPHQELLKNALVVLLNVGRHDSLCPHLDSDEACDCLIDLMQMFRDKRGIFCLACELLCRLVRTSRTMHGRCNQPEARRRIDGLSHILERKQRLDAKLRNINSSQAINTAMSKSGSPKNSPPGGGGREDGGGKGKSKQYLSNSEPVVCIQHLALLLSQ